MTVYFAHATSFCGSVWDPVIAGLDGVECVAWDFAGHGHGPELQVPVDWRRFGCQVLDETEPGGIGVGHSMGAAALTMAQLADPERFRFLLLIEPIIFPGPHGRLDHPLSLLAVRRRKTFESREAALENWSSKGAFAGWDSGALEAYMRCGLVGDGPVELACAPDLEADVYRGSNAHDTWDRLGEIEIPVLVLAGEESDTTPPDFARLQATQFKSAGLEIVPGSGHFLPMEKPAIVADRIRRIVETLG
ncbi:MAG: alpha/beta hydrolase [Actinomycetota bacterium]|nr:alpha/beta hydrolase [Actinomycetota bacterium]